MAGGKLQKLSTLRFINAINSKNSPENSTLTAQTLPHFKM
jgi:hypothetical protein